MRSARPRGASAWPRRVRGCRPARRCWSSAATIFFFSSRRRHTRWPRDWSSDVCSSDLRSRASLPRPGHHARFTVGRSPNIRRILKNGPNRLLGPNTASGCRQVARLLESPTDFVQTTAIAPDPGEDSRDDSCLLSIRLKSGLASALANRDVPVSEWSTGHDIQRSALGCMPLTAPTTLHELGSLVFSNDALHLEQ